jgi:hypothetical protein
MGWTHLKYTNESGRAMHVTQMAEFGVPAKVGMLILDTL